MDHDMSVMQSKWEMNGGGSLADPRSQLLEHEAILRQKYEKAIRELDNTKKQLHNQHENDIEQFMAVKKQLEKQVLHNYITKKYYVVLKKSFGSSTAGFEPAIF